MAFRFKKASCVVAGTFNMYIVQPPWLAKVNIIPQGVEVAISSKLDEPGFRFFAPKLPLRWFVTPSRIEVETESPQENCGDKVAAVLSNLPWTPLVALGNNAVYTAPLSAIDTLSEEMRRAPGVPEGYALAQRSFHFALSREKRVTHLQLSVTPEEIELSVNVHTELRDRDSEAAQKAARRFLEDRREAEVLAHHLFKANIEYGHSNAEPT